MTSTQTVPNITLNDDRTIPQLGLGVWQIPDDETVGVVAHAIEVGYRHIDTARIYENEAGVGEGVRRSGIDRDQLYITTKLWNTDQGFDATLGAFDASLERLGMEYIDLYLIHWPAPINGDRYIDTWRALVQLQEQGRVRSIGVANFHEPHLDRVIDDSGVVPAINQVELHPRMQQRTLRATHERLGIATQAWSPLGQGAELLEDPQLQEIAKTHGASTAQVVIAWHLAVGNVVIPKSANPGRIAENFASVDIELSAQEVEQINALDRGEDGRIGPNPEQTTF